MISKIHIMYLASFDRSEILLCLNVKCSWGQYRSILEYKNLLLVLNKLFTYQDVKTQEHTDLGVFGWDPEPDSYGQASIWAPGVENPTPGNDAWARQLWPIRNQTSKDSMEPSAHYSFVRSQIKNVFELKFLLPLLSTEHPLQ
jgi:hypothetical protein